MTHALRRGSIALCGRHVVVVWAVTGSDSAVVFPIRTGQIRRAGDVPIGELADQLVTRAKRGAAIRTARPRSVSQAQLAHSGEISGPLACLVSQAVIRTACAAAQEVKWTSDRHHRRIANAERTALR